MNNIKREPAHPGEILRSEFLEEMGITQVELAKAVNTTFRTINEIINKRRNLSPEMALKLSKYFGTSVELWLNLQNQYDIYILLKKNKNILDSIHPYRVSA
ncbi:MAG: HigA family addiction module antidote protein [Ignavibacteria bacterium]|nr:HigA family addiction module antidote protein [Ignavibacteria bacterium]